MKRILTVSLLLMLALSLTAVVSACNEPSAPSPSLTLSPPQGFAMTMISGVGFSPYQTVSIAYDNVVQPTIPMEINTNSTGCFTAIISIPNELAVGTHTVTATDSQGYSASATFTVVNMQGPQGIQGTAGQNGLNGANGTNGTNGTNGLNFNATGNILLYNGTDGLNGQNGLNGMNGTNGINGTNGLNFNATGNVLLYNGTNGLNGQNGLNGVDGTNGINGINGKDGTNGTQGPVGPQGVSGQVVYVDPPQTPGVDPHLIMAIVIAMVAFVATMILAYRKSNR